ncbi:hypothetical protein STEG23_034849, partial [Scotinomys teguina]
MTVTPLGRDQDCSLKNREPDGPAPWFLDPGGWSKTAAVSLYFIFPGICTLSLTFKCSLNTYMHICVGVNGDPRKRIGCPGSRVTAVVSLSRTAGNQTPALYKG